MAMKRFEKRLHILITVDEHRMLDELAEHEGLRSSDTVRQLIRRQHAATFGAPVVKPSKARKRKTSARNPAR